MPLGQVRHGIIGIKGDGPFGRVDEARAAAKAGLELEPNFTIARHRASARSQNPVYLGGRERIYDGMRRASIPE